MDGWLSAPDGTVIDPSTNDPNVVHGKDATSEYYRIANPQAGEWSLYSFGADLPAGPESLQLVAGTVPQSLSVGGIAEPPDIAAPSSATSSSRRDYAPYLALAAVALVAAVGGVAGWRRRRTRA